MYSTEHWYIYKHGRRLINLCTDLNTYTFTNMAVDLKFMYRTENWYIYKHDRRLINLCTEPNTGTFTNMAVNL